MTGQKGKRLGTGGKKRAAGKQAKARLERRANRLLRQLIVSAAIFLVVFVGGGLIPEQVYDVSAAVRQAITADNTLLESVEALGSAVSEGESWSEAMREWCIDTFLPASLRGEELSLAEQRGAAQTILSHLRPLNGDAATEPLTSAQAV